MTRRLLLVRHARAASSAGPDHLRPLTEEGRRQALEQGRRLRDAGPWGPVLSSPALRCVQTAGAILEALGRPDAPELHDELAESSGRAGLALAKGASDGAILVGHQPSLADLADALAGPAALAPGFQPATAILFESDGAGPWRVARVLPAP